MPRANPFKPKPPSESIEQQALAYQVRTHVTRWPDLEAFTSIPNQGGQDLGERKPGMPSGAMIRGAKMKREGLSPGYPDTLLDVARGGWYGLRVEVKKSAHWNERLDMPYAAGRPTADQKRWHERLTLNGYLVAVSWGWEPAWSLFLWYLHLPLTSTYAGGGGHPVTPDTPRLWIYEHTRTVSP